MNMKHICRYSSVMAAAAILCLASCKKEGEMVTLKVQFEQGAAQKIYLGEGNTVNWFPDEEATINDVNYTIANAAVTVPASSSGYTAVYPAATGMTAAGGNVNFPSTQNYVEVSAEGNKYQKLEAPMVAYLSAEKGTLMFRNAGSLLRVRVVNPSSTQSFHLEYIRVQAANSNISGTLPVTFSGSTTTNNIGLGSISNGSKAVRLNVNENLAAGASKDYYLILAPLDHENITIDMVGTENGQTRMDYVKTSPTQVTLNRSVIGTVRMDDCVAEDVPPAFDNCPCRDNPYSLVMALGNLQYDIAAGKFKFAASQQEVIGQTSDNMNANKGVIDLFGWGTSGYGNSLPTNTNGTAQYGAPAPGTSPYVPDHIAGTQYDWGLYNDIYSSDGNLRYPKGSWRTLTACEADWLLGNYGTVTMKDHNHNNVTHVCDPHLTAGNRRSGATINGESGIYFITIAGIETVYPSHQCVLFFPDGITLTGIDAGHSGSENFAKSKNNYWAHNLTKNDWEKLESAGVALLSGASYRNNTPGFGPQNTIYYWTSTAGAEYQYPYFFYSSTTSQGTGVFKASEQGSGSIPRSYGLAVRLVKDVE